MTDERDPKVSHRYRELGDEEPPRELDQAILASAHRAADRAAPLVAPAGRHRWYFAFGAAAIMVLAVAITVQVERQPDPEGRRRPQRRPFHPIAQIISIGRPKRRARGRPSHPNRSQTPGHRLFASEGKHLRNKPHRPCRRPRSSRRRPRKRAPSITGTLLRPRRLRQRPRSRTAETNYLQAPQQDSASSRRREGAETLLLRRHRLQRRQRGHRQTFRKVGWWLP